MGAMGAGGGVTHPTGLCRGCGCLGNEARGWGHFTNEVLSVRVTVA